MSIKSTLTEAQQSAIAEFLATHELSAGIGTEASACSIASINLALTGRLTDEIPDCMSEVIGRWGLQIQDAMPDEMRNSPAWKLLLPSAAGTGRDFEPERREIILDWLWTVSLPQYRPGEDQLRLRASWAEMCEQKTTQAALAAKVDADECRRKNVARAARTARAAAQAARAAALASRAGEYAVAYAANAAAYTAAACAGEVDAYWRAVDPCALLAKLIEVSR